MADDDFVAADEGYISSDSSFSSDDDTNLKTTSLTYDTSTYWSRIHARLPAVIAFRHNQSPPPPPHHGAANTQQPLYNPYEGQLCARQLAESVDAFLARLPPRTTRTEEAGPWIYIADPRSSRRVSDEDVAGLLKEGRRLLEAFVETRAEMEAEGSGEGKGKKVGRVTMDRKLAPLRDQLQQSIYALSGPHNIRTGKWMLFRSSTSPPEYSIESTWAAVAHATAAGQLGPAAKIATDDGSRRPGGSRLICVYTADFADKGDVRRVLDKLVGLGLVEGGARAKGIFYKADVLTHLDIQSGNEWGIKASLYSSKEMLSKAKSG